MDHARDLQALDEHYTSALEAHGDAPGAVQWSSVETQERRMAILAEVVPLDELRTASILDFGCGTGHLLGWLRRELGYEGQYTGYDISEAMIAAAVELHASDPAARFERRDILAEGIDQDVDLILVSGTFNNQVTDDWAFLTDLLTALFPHARRALAFNCLSTYVEYTTEGLAHRSPEDVFAFCKGSLSPRVTLRHDYHVKDGVVPFEFTTYVYRSELPPTPPLPATGP